MQTHTNFFYSNLFIALATLVVGSFALFLYERQRRDNKKRSAQIILLEIKNAENVLKDARERINDSDKAGMKRLPEHLFCMPTDSWFKYRHLFVKDFEPNEWDAINEFYNTCQLYDEAIKHNDSRFLEDEKAIRKNVHRASYEYSKDYIESLDPNDEDDDKNIKLQEFFNKRDALANHLTTSQNIWIYTPMKQINDVEQYLTNVDLDLSLSSVGTKLEKLTKNRLFIF